MPTVSTLLFADPGPAHSAATLQAALERARALGISQFVVASSTGRTALQAAQVLAGQGRVIGIHLARSFWEIYAAPDPALVAAAQALGVTFLTAYHGLMGAIAAALAAQGALPLSHVIAHTYYTFSQGTKVAVEDVLMAADAGLLDMDQEVISIAGTGEGCDTALVLSPAYASKFFELKVREIIAKPR